MNRLNFIKLTLTGLGSLFAPFGKLGFVPYVQHGDEDSGKIAITIDDGWYARNVEDMLNTLSGTPATFFPVGTCLARDSELYRWAIKDGYLVLNHTWSHPDLDGKDVNIQNQLSWWENAYENMGLGRFRNKALRLPGNTGTNNAHLYKTAANLGYEAIFGWTGASWGVFHATQKEILADIAPSITSGSILLFHFVEEDIAVMPAILRLIEDAGLTPVRLDRLPGVPIYERPISRPVHHRR